MILKSLKENCQAKKLFIVYRQVENSDKEYEHGLNV